MLNEGQNKLYQELSNYIPSGVLKKKNTSKTWLYGYNEKYDFVVISKTGRIGKIISINGLVIGIPPEPTQIHQRGKEKKDQYSSMLNYGITYKSDTSLNTVHLNSQLINSNLFSDKNLEGKFGIDVYNSNYKVDANNWAYVQYIN